VFFLGVLKKKKKPQKSEMLWENVPK
jgi:hypothetical protein